MKTRSVLLAIPLLGLAINFPLHAQTTIVAFNFNDQSSQTATLTASTTASNLSVSTFSVSDGGFTSTNFTTGTPVDSPGVADSGSWSATSPTKYFSFTITPSSGYTLSITTISFDYRQTATGAANYQVDIGSDTNVASGVFSTDSTWHSISQSITVTAFSDSREIRIYGYNGGSGSFALDRVTLSGTVSAIPEPSTYAALFGAAALAVAIWMRRGKRDAARTRPPAA
ncbi:MAG: PEP-CTERM sorting domain-containing protein [Verrucomicrobia bacterium]|nr:PEP-CTERM sorting domain-containing protein [Verrucomicrobiota bacterium]